MALAAAPHPRAVLKILRNSGRFQDIAYALILLVLLIYVPKGLSALSGIARSRPTEPSTGS